MADRYVYVVTGSEDGLLGVYGARDRAADRAMQYVGGDVEADTSSPWIWFYSGAAGTAEVSKEFIE